MFFSFKTCCNGNFCSLYVSRKIRFTRFLSTAFLNLRLLTVTPACNGTEASSIEAYKTFKGNAEKLLPLLNKCSISFRLLTFSSLLYENCLGMIRSFYKKSPT